MTLDASGVPAGDAPLETARLLLRPIREGDVERCVEILRAGDEHSLRDDRADFREEVEHWAEHGFGPWVAVARASGEIVGTIDVNYAGPGLEGIDPAEVEVGWMIHPSLRGRGLATEGALAASDDAFARARTSALVAYVRPDNAASLRVAAKLGMTDEGTGRSREGESVRIFRLRR